MHCTLALLFSLLHLLSVTTAAPLSMDDVKKSVTDIAKRLLVRIDKDFKTPTDLPPTDDLDGAASIVAALDGYNSLISSRLSGVQQVKVEISSLSRLLDLWRQCDGGEQRPKPSVPGQLQELLNHREFIHTVSPEALMRVKEILSLLLKNLDQLVSCGETEGAFVSFSAKPHQASWTSNLF